jgi:hypothetical protein
MRGVTDRTAAFVVSQDGHVSLFWKQDGRVLLKRDVNTANPNMIGNNSVMKLAGVIVLGILALQGAVGGGPDCAGEGTRGLHRCAHGEAEALLERAVNINSGSMNLEGVRETGRLFRAEFDALGFKTEWIDGTAWGRAGHLVARHEGPSRSSC